MGINIITGKVSQKFIFDYLKEKKMIKIYLYYHYTMEKHGTRDDWGILQITFEATSRHYDCAY
jgi:hypothetical protein